MVTKHKYGSVNRVYLGIGWDIIDFKPIRAVTIILRTSGCHWRRCKICNYYLDGARRPPSDEDLISQIDDAISRFPEGELMVKIFTSGSFFDTREITEDLQKKLIERLPIDRIRKLIIESRPEFVTPSSIRYPSEIFDNFEFAIGLETTSDAIRRNSIDKGFNFEEFKHAVKVAAEAGAGIRTYLLLKPPYLTEKEAIDDMLKSAEELIPYTKTISLNLTTVREHTPLYDLWKKGYYRPPWLWSAVEVMKQIRADRRFDDIAIISDPIAAGKPWGPHNCRKCDNIVKDAIRHFSITQDLKDLSGLDCSCKRLWEKVLELEKFTHGVPLA
ncbi:TIGR01210 family radical SAM protein [Methanosarcinales archaeon]|nr:MAG: TIGR01210 family radical SAM protein [Methanosarcinales archaeon]